MSNNKENSQRPQTTPEVVEEVTTQSATKPAATAEQHSPITREAVPTPVARPIVEVVAEIQTPAFADGERDTRGTVPTPVARPIVEVVAEVQTPAFADRTPQEQMEEEEAEVLAAGSKK
jgi:hypothetical protein